MITVRTTKPTDRETVADIYYEAEDAAIDKYDDPHPGASELRRKGQLFLAPGSGLHGWIAFTDDVPAGFLLRARPQRGEVELERLYVRPSCQGLGVSSELMEAVETAFHGLRGRLYVRENRDDVRGIYEGKGWVCTGQVVRLDWGLTHVGYTKTFT